MKARIRIVSDRPGKPLVIRDMGHRTGMSVTNDADAVVAHLHAAGHLPDNRRLHYYDSQNELSELVHKDGRFIGYAPVNPQPNPTE